MTLGQIERGGFASKRFGNSFEAHGVFSAGRLPWLFVDLANVYLSHDCRSFFSIEVISLGPLHQYFLQGVVYHRPFAAVGIITGITSRPAAARIIGDHVINEILVASIAELVRFTGLKKEGVARPDFSHSILVAHTAASRDNKIKLRFSRVRVIWAKRFPLRNPHQRKIKRMPLRQVERLRFASKSNGNIFCESPKLPLWGFAFLLWHIFEIYFPHISSATKSFFTQITAHRTNVSQNKLISHLWFLSDLATGVNEVPVEFL